MSDEAHFIFRFVDLKEFAEFLKRDDVKETIREIAREPRTGGVDQTAFPRPGLLARAADTIARETEREPVIVDQLGRKVNPIWHPEDADVASTLSPQETALAEIADLRRKLDEAREAWRADKAELESLRRRAEKAEARIAEVTDDRDTWRKDCTSAMLQQMREGENLNLMRVDRDEWKARAENAEAKVEDLEFKVAHLDQVCDARLDVIEGQRSAISRLKGERVGSWRDHAEKAEAKVGELETENDRLKAEVERYKAHSLRAANIAGYGEIVKELREQADVALHQLRLAAEALEEVPV